MSWLPYWRNLLPGSRRSRPASPGGLGGRGETSIGQAPNYREIVENASELIYTHELSGRLTSVNKAFERITGYRREEALGANFYEWLEGESRSRLEELIRQQLGGYPQDTCEITLVSRDGRRVFLEASVRLYFQQGVAAGVQGIARDIRDRKHAELLERDRNQIFQMVAAGEPLEIVLSELCRMVERQLDGSRCFALLAKDDHMVPAGSPGLKEDLLDHPAAEACLERYPFTAAAGSVLGEFLLDWKSRPAGALSPEAVMEAAGRLAVVAIEQRQLTDRLAYQATHDPLTGLPNRTLLEMSLNQALEEAARHGRALAVLFMDFDRFKQINDTLGHLVGDQVLEQAARRLQGSLRKSDFLARLGGDEFTAVASDLADSRSAAQVAEKLLATLREPFLVENRELYLTASIGISMFPRDGRDAAALQRAADAAMYRAKNRGKNRYEFFTPDLIAATLERFELETALRYALDRKELMLYCHPETSRDGRLWGFEALLAWRHPRLGLISPSQFIPIAEECGLIVPIGAWALQEACRQGAAWQGSGRPGVHIAVNVSATQFARPDFVETVSQALVAGGLDPALLELELTESVVLRRVEESVLQMQRLRDLGAKITIDDFGTGYSSLSYLRRLPIDAVKIDQSFLRGAGKEPGVMPLVEAIIALAHGLGLEVVAEGVENQEQLEALRKAGCDRFQGYLWGEPVPAQDVPRLLEEGIEAPHQRVMG